MTKLPLAEGFTLTIEQDEDPSNPREDDCLFGTMFCWHRRYSLGDKHDYASPDDFPDDFAIKLPLYLHDHSGITMATSPFSCQWDSGQVGWICVSREDIEKEYGTSDNAFDKAREYLENEVKTYDQYLCNDIWGYTITDKTGEEVDSCWGFYGDDPMENGMLDNFGKEHQTSYKELHA